MGEGVKDADGSVGAGAPSEQPAAAGGPPPPDESAPYGYTKDRKTGGWRAKKRPGRGGNPNLHAAGDEPIDGKVVDDGQDPDPSWHTPGESGGRQHYEATQDERDELAGLIALLYSIPADLLLMVDPLCFGAVNDNLGDIIDAAVPIIARSKTAVKWATSAHGLILYAKLIAALKPIGVAFWQHHVTHSVRLERDENGAVFAVPQDYSAYTAA